MFVRDRLALSVVAGCRAAGTWEALAVSSSFPTAWCKVFQGWSSCRFLFLVDAWMDVVMDVVMDHGWMALCKVLIVA